MKHSNFSCLLALLWSIHLPLIQKASVSQEGKFHCVSNELILKNMLDNNSPISLKLTHKRRSCLMLCIFCICILGALPFNTSSNPSIKEILITNPLFTQSWAIFHRVRFPTLISDKKLEGKKKRCVTRNGSPKETYPSFSGWIELTFQNLWSCSKVTERNRI